MNDEICQAEVELIEDHWAEFMKPLVCAMDPEGLEGHRLEFCGVDVWLVTKAISTTMLRQVCKHKVHLKHKGLIVIQIRCVKLNAELADIIELHLLLAIPNEKRPGRECVLILDDVSRDQMVMVSP